MRCARQMKTRAAVGLGLVGLLLGGGSGAQSATNPYPNMAPLAQYLSPSREAEIALARSAAPPSISAEAEILAFGPKGYETAVKGQNPFVCIVERGWSNNYDKPDFWNPKVRQPHCFNQVAARSVLPAYLKRTEWVHGGAVPLGDVESHQGCGRSARNRLPRAGLDGLYDVQGHLSGRRHRPLVPALDVLIAAHSGARVGCRPQGVAGIQRLHLSRAADHFLRTGGALVRRHRR